MKTNSTGFKRPENSRGKIHIESNYHGSSNGMLFSYVVAYLLTPLRMPLARGSLHPCAVTFFRSRLPLCAVRIRMALPGANAGRPS